MFIFNLKKNIKSSNSQKGFTLVEMLVAVFIFSVALAALMSIAARGLQAARYAQDEVRADYLALEAIEVVRNKRDQAFIRGLPNTTWESVFDNNNCLSHSSSSPNNSCGFELPDSPGDDIILYPCNDCTVYFSENNGIFAHFENSIPNTYNPTNYTRNIRIERTNSGLEEVIVTVNVTWPTGSVEYTASLMLWLVQ